MGVGRVPGATVGQDDTALAGRLILELERELQSDPARFARALLVFQHARELVPAVGVNPRIVLPAALFLAVEGGPAPNSAMRKPQPVGEADCGFPFRRLLSRARLDDRTLDAIASLLNAFRNRREERCVEVRVLEDSLTLADLTTAERPADVQDLESLIQSQLQTEAGRTRARQLFLPVPGAGEDAGRLGSNPPEWSNDLPL